VQLDRQSIERRDFPIGRRGYEPAAVDAHLQAVAAELEELEGYLRTRDSESLGSAAAGQVQSILDAAETTAADIKRQTAEAAEAAREQADRDAARTRAGARAHVLAVSRATAALLERVESMDQEVGALLGSLHSGAGRLASDLRALEASMEELYGAAAGVDVEDDVVPDVVPDTDVGHREEFAGGVALAGGEASAGDEVLAGDEPLVSGGVSGGGKPLASGEALAGREALAADEVSAGGEVSAGREASADSGATVDLPILDMGHPLKTDPPQTEPERPSPPVLGATNGAYEQPPPAPFGPSAAAVRGSGAPSPSPSSVGDADPDGARLIALNMALNGESREQADRYLAEHFQLADREKLLDEVYAAIEG
jgi:DivIVA domain-containing protein